MAKTYPTLEEILIEAGYGERIEARIEKQIEARVEKQIEARIEKQIEARVEKQIEARVEKQIEARMKTQEKERIARNLLIEGMPVDKIVRLTELSIERVHALTEGANN